MFEAYKIGVAMTLLNHVSPVLSSIVRDFAKTNAEAALFQKRLDSIKMGMVGGLMATGAGIALASMFKTPIEDALKFERTMLRVKNIGGLDGATLTEVRSNALSGKYRGIGASESVDLFRDLHAAFGEAKEAKEFMPLFAGMARVTQGTFGKSAVQGEEDVRALAKLAERRGGTKSPEAMERAMDISMKMLNASGGAVTPKDALAFSARMGAMGNAMSDTGLLKMWALMQEQGGSKAGTALNSALQNLVNGRGTEGSGMVLHRLGLVDEAANDKNLRDQYGESWSKHRNKVTANSLINADLAKTDMVGYVETTMLPKISAYLDKNGIRDPKKRDAETVSLIAQGLSNRLGADSIALIATQLPRILKDYHIAEASGGLRSSIKNFDESPVAKFQDLEARWNTALVNLGVSALPIVIPLVNRLTSGIAEFSKYAQENPRIVKTVVGGILGLSAALITLGGLTLAINGVRALHLASVVMRAGMASSIVPLSMVTKGIVGLGAAGLAFGAGWTVGTLLYKAAIEGTKFSDWLGGLISKVLSWMGNAEAQEIQQLVNKGKKPASETPLELGDPDKPGRRSFTPPAAGAPAFKIENKIDYHGLTTKVTQIQAKDMARAPAGANFADGTMNAFPLAYSVR